MLNFFFLDMADAEEKMDDASSESTPLRGESGVDREGGVVSRCELGREEKGELRFTSGVGGGEREGAVGTDWLGANVD